MRLSILESSWFGEDCLLSLLFEDEFVGQSRVVFDILMFRFWCLGFDAWILDAWSINIDLEIEICVSNQSWERGYDKLLSSCFVLRASCCPCLPPYPTINFGLSSQTNSCKATAETPLHMYCSYCAWSERIYIGRCNFSRVDHEIVNYTSLIVKPPYPSTPWAIGSIGVVPSLEVSVIPLYFAHATPSQVKGNQNWTLATLLFLP